MATGKPPYSRIQHGDYFFELIFTDMEVATLQQFRDLFERRYPQLREAPWIRALYDFREVHAFSIYALNVFLTVVDRGYATSNIRIAVLVGQDLIDSQLQYSVGELLDLPRRAPGTIRLYRERPRAFDWLWEGIPPGTGGESTSIRSSEEGEE